MTLTIEPLNHEYIDLATKVIQRHQLPFQEYKRFSDKDLKKFFKGTLESYVSNPDSICLVVINKAEIIGFLNATRNIFDSENFGHDCYTISDLTIFRNSFNEVSKAVSALLSELEGNIRASSKSAHLSVSINNNLVNCAPIFNSLIKNSYYFFHTLLSFQYPGPSIVIDSKESLKKDIIIRTAVKSDAEALADIALKYIKYSRFHLDPYLDDKLASDLISNSARNSILEGYADVVFIAEVDGRIAGYYSAKKKNVSELAFTMGEVIISVIDPDFRGRGLFSMLDKQILKWFEINTDSAELGTYLANYPVHKTWIRKGLPLLRGLHQFSKKSDVICVAIRESEDPYYNNY